MTLIHPTASVDPKADLGAGVRVRAHAVVGAGVILGDDCDVGEGAVLRGPATIGKGNVFYPHCVIGTPPQDLKYQGEETELIIGDGNKIREFVTINRGTDKGGGKTQLGNENLLMACSHVAHDCLLGDHIVMANNVLLAGHIEIQDHATLSGAAAVHHFSTIGTAAFVGGMTRVVQDVPPFMIMEGNPAKIRGVNVVRLERLQMSAERVQALREAYRAIWKTDKPRKIALEEFEARSDLSEEVQQLCRFIHRSEEGDHGRFRETLRR